MKGETSILSCGVVTPADGIITSRVVCNPVSTNYISEQYNGYPPVLQLPSETRYIFHELPRKWVFLVTDCMLKHWKMKAPNICVRKTL